MKVNILVRILPTNKAIYTQNGLHLTLIALFTQNTQ